MQRTFWAATLTLGLLVSPAGGQQALHCDGLDPTAEGDATRAFECVSKLFADLEAALARIRALEVQAHEVPETRLVPKGAVLAFDNPDGCPEGWSHFAEAQSRAIVGASRGTFANGYAEDEGGTPLTGYKYREHGGWKMVALTEAQMPSHHHKLRHWIIAIREDRPNHVKDNAIDGTDYDMSTHKQPPTESSGEDVPHPNMPPYIALYYCKKD